MSKILRSSNRVNTRKDISKNKDIKIPNKPEKEAKNEIKKDNRKRRHDTEEILLNEFKIEKEEQKENEQLSLNGPIDDIDEPSEYELLRQRNIEERRLMFQQLDIEEVHFRIILVKLIRVSFIGLWPSFKLC